MRSAILAYTGVMCSIALVVIISVITMKSSYYELVRQSLDDSLEYTVGLVQVDRHLEAGATGEDGYRDIGWASGDSWINTQSSEVDKKANDEDFKKKFVEYLAANIDSKVDKISIDIYGADSEYGVISVKVKAEFTYPFGKQDYVEVTKTILLDKEITV